MKEKDGDDVRQRSILKTVKGTAGNHYMEYNIMSGWSCSCTSFKYRRTCKHVNDANAEQNECGSCSECCHFIVRSGKCVLWRIDVPNPDYYNCGVWEEKK